MKCLKMIEAKGTGHKNDIVILKTLEGNKKVEMTREELKTAIINQKLCVTNMEVTKNNRLVKTNDKVAWVNIELLSFDMSNGICEVHIKSDNLNQINEFLTTIGKYTLSDETINSDESVVYTLIDSDVEGKHDVVVRWVHIDMVLNAFKEITHLFAVEKLVGEREKGNPNFSYMTDEQFASLVAYLRDNLNCK